MIKQGYPKIFGSAFDTLIDIAQDVQKNTEGAKQNYNWLSKRDLVKVKYLNPGCYKYLITNKGKDFIQHVKEEKIENLEYHAEVLVYVGLLASLKEEQRCPEIQDDIRAVMVSRLNYLKLCLSNKLTERGNFLINHILETKSKDMIIAPFFRDNYREPYVWWANWLAKNIPAKEWAIILSDDEVNLLDKRLYLEKLKEFVNIST